MNLIHRDLVEYHRGGRLMEIIFLTGYDEKIGSTNLDQIKDSFHSHGIV